MLSRLTGLSREELRPVIRLGLVYAAIGAAVAVGDATVQAVFVARAGADRLPEMLFARAVISPLFAYAYARLARPSAPRAVLVILLGVAAAGAIGGRVLITHGANGALGAYVIHEVLASLVTVHWGVYLLHHLRGDHALRGTPSVYAAARLGAAVAGAGLAPLVSYAGAPVGLYVTAALFVLAGVLALVSRKAPTDDAVEADDLDSIPPEADDAPRPSLRPERKRGFALLLSSPLLAAIAVSTAAMVFVRFSLRYQQQSLLEGVDEHQLAALLAIYTTGANIVGAVVQLGLLGRILSRLGLTTTNLFYALATVVAQVVLLVLPGLPAALGARFADSELKHVIKTPLSSLFYEAFSPKDRGAARAIILGLVSPAAQVLGAVGLAAAIAGADVTTVGYVGLAACGVFALATLAQNRGYDRAIRRDSLRA